MRSVSNSGCSYMRREKTDQTERMPRLIEAFFLRSATMLVLLNFLVTVKAAPHECVVGTGLPKA